MQVIDPERATFGGFSYTGVLSVSVDRTATKEIVAFGDGGPHAAFVDVVRQRVTARLVREVRAGEEEEPLPGDRGVLEFEVSPGRSDGGRRRASVSCVLIASSGKTDRGGAVRTLTFVGESQDGMTDPVEVSRVG